MVVYAYDYENLPTLQQYRLAQLPRNPHKGVMRPEQVSLHISPRKERGLPLEGVNKVGTGLIKSWAIININD